MERDEVLSVLKVLARYADLYDDRVWPPDRDDQQIGVRLGDLRKASLLVHKLEQG